jgi:putative Holliday junction resolvase
MGRILAIDYGEKRTGIAVTDPLKIIASPLDTVPTREINDFIKQYIAREDVELIVVGYPEYKDGETTPWQKKIINFAKKLEKLTGIEVKLFDESYTSKLAANAMIEGNMKKKNRRKKENLDKLSATILLQDYLKTI